MTPPMARFAGFMNIIALHCYTQNMKAIENVVLEEQIVLCFSHCMSMEAIC